MGEIYQLNRYSATYMKEDSTGARQLVERPVYFSVEFGRACILYPRRTAYRPGLVSILHMGRPFGQLHRDVMKYLHSTGDEWYFPSGAIVADLVPTFGSLEEADLWLERNAPYPDLPY